jgi:2-polyprenyl-6-methoxyphenol hydroxylase-like FAD-dependent oxidoreductase
MTTAKHQILVVGGGAAGITVAARVLRTGYSDVAVIEPSNMHLLPTAVDPCGRRPGQRIDDRAHRILGDAQGAA